MGYRLVDSPLRTNGWLISAFRLFQELLKHLFIILIITPTEMGKSLLNFCVVQVVSGPVLAREATPDRVVVVDSDRVGEAVFLHLVPAVIDNTFEAVFRGMHTDHSQIVLLVFLRQSLTQTEINERKTAQSMQHGVRRCWLELSTCC